ncbi:hypothetical protein N7539_008724 [Penicillium diatomitis]|uniref:Uncharacterized protein n=1 Tax=Penicillium diatomitis TaxID=2819901 RepID=A0A9W9WR50_9EURO|nr:uncharacterized protein N7539_008724 [Penicillium diatomitis]KAJ5472155.1 hypothetical protein N7539_008724 [Penicillium diatomitis]
MGQTTSGNLNSWQRCDQTGQSSRGTPTQKCTTAEAAQLKQDKGWIKGLGQRAELVLPTYGVLVDNYIVVPNAEISYVGWLTKEATLKHASSIVVEFKDPEKANAVIYAGMAWEGQIHQC